jgi:hypothetical protein
VVAVVAAMVVVVAAADQVAVVGATPVVVAVEVAPFSHVCTGTSIVGKVIVWPWIPVVA